MLIQFTTVLVLTLALFGVCGELLEEWKDRS